MNDSPDQLAEFQRVRIQAQQIRASAMRTRIMTAQTFCWIAECELRRNPDLAGETLFKVRRTINEIDRHIAEPNHVSTESASELTELVSALKARADSIERWLNLDSYRGNCA
jgi:hypothetical protein